MIGVFDSGVGGLTVVKEIFKELPDYQIIYFGDTARFPYGTKGADFVKKYSEKITRWLLNRGAKIIVVACHTSSAWASDSLKKEFKKTPIFEMASPVIKEVLSLEKNRIGIIGTPGTVKSKAFERKLLKAKPCLKIYSVACPLFVPLVEAGMIKNKVSREIAREYLRPLKKKKIDVLILACTHYPLLEGEIKKVMDKKLKVINPAKSLAKELKLFLKKNPDITKKIKKSKKHQFFFSDQPSNLDKISHICLKKKIKIKIIDPF